MGLTKILVLMVVAILPLLVHGVYGKGNKAVRSRWGCVGSSECMQVCRRSCMNFMRPLCFQNQCYCQAVGYPRADYRRMNLGPNEPTPDLMFDYDLKL